MHVGQSQFPILRGWEGASARIHGGGVVYITINVFIMQSFMFLSGYFSKNVEKSRKTSFKTALWPYLLSIPFFYAIRLLVYGNATFYLDQPPFAMWFMLALFVYKFLLKDMVKVPCFMAICLCLYMIAGMYPFPDRIYGSGKDRLLSAVFYDRLLLQTGAHTEDKIP